MVVPTAIAIFLLMGTSGQRKASKKAYNPETLGLAVAEGVKAEVDL
jgi:hypothetical protein